MLAILPVLNNSERNLGGGGVIDMGGGGTCLTILMLS